MKQILREDCNEQSITSHSITDVNKLNPHQVEFFLTY